MNEKELVFTYHTAKANIEYTCVSKSPGLIVKLHPSEELPNFLHDQINIQVGEFPTILIKPKVTRISKGLAKVSPKL